MANQVLLQIVDMEDSSYNDVHEPLEFSSPSEGVPMDAIAERLDQKLRSWKEETANEVRRYVSQIIELADRDALDVARFPEVEQEVLNILDEHASR